MKILTKRIRELVGMSQEQFAKELSTTVVPLIVGKMVRQFLI